MDPKKESLRKIPTVHAVAAAGDIGSVLKAARQKKGVSIDAVAQQTRIPKKYLEAMESNRTDELPALVYLRGFLKGYCDFLEVEFEPLWKLLQPPPAPAAAAPAAEEKKAAPKPAPAGHAPAPAAAHGDEHGKPDLSGPLALGVSIAVALGVFIWLKRQDSRPAEPQPEAPAALASIPQTEDELSVTLNEETWLSLKADGVTVFEGLAPKGAQQKWKAKKGFVLRTPHPKNLSLLKNGTAFQLPEPDAAGDYHIE